MKRWWLLALLLNLAFFGAWTALEERRHRGALEFLLATEGVDPRDIWSGQYMELGYPASHSHEPGWPGKLASGTPFAVRLQLTGEISLGGRSWPAFAAEKWVPVPDGDFSAYPVSRGWARGKLEGRRIVFGIERYYFQEDREAELRKLVPGRYFALVALSPDGQLRIRQLVW